MLFILDRDGVINFDSDNYIKSPDEWIVIPGSLEAIGLLTRAQHTIVIATNQSGVNRGLFSLEILQAIHEKMLALITAAGGKIEKIYFCPHTPSENCDCRKPKTGLLEQIKKDFPNDFANAIYIGDSEKDYLAAQKMQCEFILVKTGNGLRTLEHHNHLRVFDDLLRAVKTVLS